MAPVLDIPRAIVRRPKRASVRPVRWRRPLTESKRGLVCCPDAGTQPSVHGFVHRLQSMTTCTLQIGLLVISMRMHMHCRCIADALRFVAWRLKFISLLARTCSAGQDDYALQGPDKFLNVAVYVRLWRMSHWNHASVVAVNSPAKSFLHTWLPQRTLRPAFRVPGCRLNLEGPRELTALRGYPPRVVSGLIESINQQLSNFEVCKLLEK